VAEKYKNEPTTVKYEGEEEKLLGYRSATMLLVLPSQEYNSVPLWSVLGPVNA
jgi:hypothetical protein